MRRSKIKIFSTMIGLTLIIASSLVFFILYQADDIVFENNLSAISSTVFKTASTLDAKLNHTEMVAKTVRQYFINHFNKETFESNANYKTQWHEEMGRLIQTLCSESDNISSIYIAFIPKDFRQLDSIGYGDRNKDGSADALSFKHPALLSVLEASWYHDTWMKSSTTWQMGAYKDALDTKALEEITCTMPVKIDGATVAIISVGTDFKTFSNLMNTDALPDLSYQLLANEKNEILIHPTLDYKTDLSSILSGRFTELIDYASKKSFGYKEYIWTDGSEKVLVFKKLSNQWTTAAAVPKESLLKNYFTLLKGLLLLIAFSLGVAIILSRYLTYSIYKPINDLFVYVSNITPEQSPQTIALDPKFVSVEMKALVQTILILESDLKENMNALVSLNKQLDQAVLDKSNELQKTNTILGITVDSLKKQQYELEQVNSLLESNKAAIQKAQRQVTNSEKVASIGYLISGISHELNTPIGNNITLTTFIDNEIKKMKNYLSYDPIPVDLIQDSYENLFQSLSLLNNNLNQAQNIITKIKGLTKETIQSKSVTFNLAQAIDVLSKTIFSNYPNQKLSLMLVADTELMIHTDQEQFLHIIEQLILNSIQHGFEKQATGQIILRVHHRGSQLIMHYFDDGCGIEASQIQHIFTPFYSTKFGVNKGLGLNIVYHTVTKFYNGQITCDTAAQVGVHFEIRLNLPPIDLSKEVSST